MRPREYHCYPLEPPRHQSIFITSHQQEGISYQMIDHLSLLIAFPFNSLQHSGFCPAINIDNIITLHTYMLQCNQCLDEWCQAVRENLRRRQRQPRRMLLSGDFCIRSVCPYRTTRCSVLVIGNLFSQGISVIFNHCIGCPSVQWK